MISNLPEVRMFSDLFLLNFVIILLNKSIDFIGKYARGMGSMDQ